MPLSDIEIAQNSRPLPVTQVAAGIGIKEEYVRLYGQYKAKIMPEAFKGRNKKGKLILVTAMSPTHAGEGKTTVSIGLADSLNAIGKKTVLALREPSLGPIFGIKGGACGGGYAQVIPMEEINLHFTGDFYAVEAANNLLAAMTDNHIHSGNALGIDPNNITWKRCLDMNDRQLRFIVDGLGGKVNGCPHEDGFDITAASQIMAVLCLSSDLADLKERLSRLIVGFTYEGSPVTAGDLHAQGAMAALLKEAVNPNLVQTLEHTPAFVHGGPFANIAHGCNTVIATKAAMCTGDYVVTEAGFGADLGAEKFLDIKCRSAGIFPSCAVLVVTVRAVKANGGIENVCAHINNLKNVYGLPVVAAVNRFPDDSEEDIAMIKDECRKLDVSAVSTTVFADGSAGGTELAQCVSDLCDLNPVPKARFAYDDESGTREKIEAVAKKIYHAGDVVFLHDAEKKLDLIDHIGAGRLPVCIAKTQYSFTDDPKKTGAPTGFTIKVRDLKINAGAGFIVALTGQIMTMPGLPKVPAAEGIDIDASGRISGLF